MKVSPERFEELVAEALDGLPPWVQERMENVDVLVESRPPDGQPGMLGLYEGVPLTRRGTGYFGHLPDRITLFRSALARDVRTEQELRGRIRHTVVHEVAHFFGISDDRLREIDRY
jgi:predicted Zn-dependent protease with MMP-like domain